MRSERATTGCLSCPCLRSIRRQTGRITSNEIAVKALRQNVTSKRAADSSWRDTTPAIDHMSVTASMRKTAWVWVRRLRARKGMDVFAVQVTPPHWG
ncbi:hypothetical protein D9M69_673350 [compost metagenome]